MGTLYLVATPIGNLSDLSERALAVLREADLIAAEDTRHTLKLLNHFAIKKPMISYFEHNKSERGQEILRILKEGKDVVLVSDAGTPAISDPGEDLVRLCAQNDISVVPIPGPCALINALIVSGLPTGRFSFEGFLSVNKKNRKQHLESIRSDTHTLIFYEAPHKLKNTLADMLQILGDRQIALVRELTKKYEEVLRMTLSEAAAYYETTEPKGEFVLVLSGAPEDSEENPLASLTVFEHMDYYLEQGISKKEAIKLVAKDRKVKKQEIYSIVAGDSHFQENRGQ